jgi:S-adenosyl-L-homocysteine hydrolase
MLRCYGRTIHCILHTAYSVVEQLCVLTPFVSAHLCDAHYAHMHQHYQGVVDATAAGAHKLLQLAADSALLVPAMNVSDAVTHSRFAASQSDRVKASLVQGLHTLCSVDVAGKVTRPNNYYLQQSSHTQILCVSVRLLRNSSLHERERLYITRLAIHVCVLCDSSTAKHYLQRVHS